MDAPVFRPRWQLALACAASLILLPSPGSAKPRKPQGKPDAAPEWVPPGDWSAGARVRAFLQTYLEQSILAPLDKPALPPRAALGALGSDFAAHFAAAQSPTDRALYNDAANLCDLLGRLLDERERRQDALLALRKGGNAVNPLDMPTAGVSGHYGWNVEAEHARAQQRQEVQARLNALDRNNIFVATNLREWTDLSAGYRKAVQAAAIRVDTDQIRADAAMKTPPAPVATVTGTSTPAPAASAPAATVTGAATPAPAASPLPPAASPPPAVAADTAATPASTTPTVAPANDPVAGTWMFGGDVAEVSPWHAIDGQRHGSWSYMMDTPQGRYYEFHWRKKGKISYLTLSSDGKHLAGKDQDGKPTSADRK